MTMQSTHPMEKSIEPRSNGIISQPKPKLPQEIFPALASGDRLSRVEFERRYSARSDIKKAELIEGVVYVSSPVRNKQHGLPHQRINTWLGLYCAATPGVLATDNATLRLDTANEPQPDVMVWIDEAWGGQLYSTEDDYLAGVPELIVEIAASSAAYDLHDKMNAYQRNGVQEYLVLLPYEQQTRWYAWRAGEYHELTPDEQGILHSQVFPGLYFDSARFWSGDLAGLLALLQQGISSPEHADFVAQLAGKQLTNANPEKFEEK